MIQLSESEVIAMTRKNILCAFGVALLAGGASAATINVPADHATVQAAVNAANPTGDEIVIAAGATVLGGVLVDGKSLTIRGATSANRPILVLAQNGASATGGIGATTAGFLVAGDGTTVTVQDLILIPSTSSIPGRLFQASTLTAGATITVNLTNILATGNNGSNVPSVTDPWDNTTPIGTGNTSDHFYLVNRAFTPPSLVDAVGVYTLTNVVSIRAGRDGIVAYPNGVGSSLSATGVAVARATRNPIQWGDDNAQHTAFTVTGTRATPGLLLVNNTGTFSGPDVTGINAGGVVDIDHLVCVGNSGAFYLGADVVTSATISDSLFMNTTSTASGLYLNSGAAAPGAITVEGSTFFNNGAAASNQGHILIDTAAATYTIRDNIFAGSGGAAIVHNVAGTGAQTSTTNNGVVFGGVHALANAELGTGAPSATYTGNISADPAFSSTTVAAAADLATAFDVTASSYEGAGTAGADISGWGDMDVPPPPASANGWEMYQ